MRKILIFLLLFFCFNSYSQGVKLDKPYNTTLVDKGSLEQNGMIADYYLYDSYLSKNEIILFYESWFKDVLGLYRQNSSTSERLDYIGSKSIYNLYFLAGTGSKNTYQLIIVDASKEDTCTDCNKGKVVKKYSVLPDYPNGRLLENEEYLNGKLIATGYFAKESNHDVVDFYKREMAKLGWTAIKVEDRSGEYTPSEMVKLVGPYSSYDINSYISQEAANRKTTISGKTLMFKRGVARCRVAVYTLGKDTMQAIVDENFSSGMGFHHYGETIIGIAYMPQGEI